MPSHQSENHEAISSPNHVLEGPTQNQGVAITLHATSAPHFLQHIALLPPHAHLSSTFVHFSSEIGKQKLMGVNYNQNPYFGQHLHLSQKLLQAFSYFTQAKLQKQP